MFVDWVINSDKNNPHTFYHLECTTGTKLVVKKFIKAVPNETLGDILEREIPPSCRVCGVFTAEDKSTHSSELDLTMSLTNLKKLRLASAGDPTLKESLVNSLTPVLQVLKERFSHLKRKEEPVKVHEAATDEEVQDMAQTLYVIDDTIDCSALADVKVADHPRLKDFMERHCRCRHYSFQVCKFKRTYCNAMFVE